MEIMTILIEEIERLKEEVKELKEIKFKRFNNEDCWIYQGDDEDKLESLVCPIVIDAKELLKLKKALTEKVSKQDSRFCPICGERYVTTCKCPRGDKTCKNGHSWHTCTVHKTIVLGKSDHSSNAFSCSCGVGK